VSESLVGFGHTVGIFFFLESAAFTLARCYDLSSQLFGHAATVPFAAVTDQPFHAQGYLPVGANFRWDLEGGGALISQGIHTIDLLLWLMGDVTQVSGKAITAVHDIDVEDTVVASLEFADGAIGTVEAATSAYPGYARRIEITGTEGTIILENDNIVAADLRTPSPEIVSKIDKSASERSSSAVISDVSGHRRIIEDFIQAIANDRAPLCDGREGRRSVELIQAVYESSKTRQFVSIPA